MSDTLKQDQHGGDGSTNVQAQTVNITSITVSEARQIALDVFKANALELAGIARDLFEARGREFIERYLEELQRRKPEALDSFRDPDMQYALFTAQKAYACSGDKDLAAMLLDILVDRAAENQRSLKQIVLTQSLSVASKLTPEQFDILSLVFVLKYAHAGGFPTLEQFNVFFESFVLPFAPSVVQHAAPYQHLASMGCAQEHTRYPLANILRDNYPAVFCSGFTEEEAATWCKGMDKEIRAHLIPCRHDSSRLQIDDVELISWSDESPFGLRLRSLKNLHIQRVMDEGAICKYLLSRFPASESLLHNWDATLISYLRLTTVGIA